MTLRREPLPPPRYRWSSLQIERNALDDLDPGVLDPRRWDDGSLTSPDLQVRIEGVLSIGRLCLCAAILAAVPAALHSSIYVSVFLVASYLIFAAAVYLSGRTTPATLVDAGVKIHLADLGWILVVAACMSGPASPSLMLMVFAVIAAAARWGRYATLVTGIVASVLFVVGTILAVLIAPDADSVPFMTVVAQVTYTVVLAVTIGFVATAGRALVVEQAVLSRVLSGVSLTTTFSEGLHVYMQECLAYVGSSQALIAVEEIATRHVHLWSLSGQYGGAGRRPVLEDLGANGLFYFSSRPYGATVWQVKRDSSGRLLGRAIGSSVATEPENIDGAFERAILERHGASSLLASETAVSNQWRARLILLDPAQFLADHLPVIRLIAAHVSPALFNAYKISQLRSRVRRMERTRLARELHDGILQTLIGLEMEIEAIRKQVDAIPVGEPRLRDLRDHLRRDIADTRDLMQRLQPAGMTGADVLRTIAELAQRLRRDVGIDVRLATASSKLDCAPQVCTHLTRIIQEALSNVRKHSGAETVNITITFNGRLGRLLIADDGRGLGFDARMTLEDLEARDLGPKLIRQRVRAMRGNLVVTSRPGEGTDIEVEFPRRANG
jgi:signal transduction histidine kinase